MGDSDVKLDKQTFHDRLSHLYTAWKADKRSGDSVFGGISSIVILMGKAEETSSYQKTNAIHVSVAGDCVSSTRGFCG